MREYIEISMRIRLVSMVVTRRLPYIASEIVKSYGGSILRLRKQV